MNESWRDRFVANPPSLEGGVELDVLPEDGGFLLRLRQGDVAVDLRAAFLSTPYPSGLKRLLARDPGTEAVIVEEIPSGLDAAAREAGISYLDQLGHGRVVAPGLVYLAHPQPRAGRRRAGRAASPFAPKASRLVRALLADPARSWRLGDLARRVAVDPGNAHRVLATLGSMGLVERNEDRYVASDPGFLLETWAQSAPRPRERIELQLSVDLRKWLREMLGSRPDGFAVSGELAAEQMAPYLEAREALLHCLDNGALERVEESAAEPGPLLPATGRVIAVPADDRVRDFGSTVDTLPIVSPAQLYVDLFWASGRAREAAEQVRREVLRF